MTRILVTGASGLLGSNLILEAQRAGYATVASSATRSINRSGIEWIPADLTEPDAVTRLFRSAKPDWVVHCAAATDVDRSESDPEWAYLLNRDVASQVAVAAQEAQAELVHISTDAVFDGEASPYGEAATPRPVNVYGDSKLAGEAAVSEAHPGAVIIRTNFYGWSPQGRDSLSEWFLDGLLKNDARHGFTDVRVNPLLANDLAQIVLSLLKIGTSGIFHVGARDCVSKYEFGILLARTFGLDEAGIQPTSVDSTGLRARRPRRLCLRVEKVEQTVGAQMPTLQHGLERLRELDKSGYRRQVYELVANPREVAG